jgi:hypothetical protein
VAPGAPVSLGAADHRTAARTPIDRRVAPRQRARANLLTEPVARVPVFASECGVVAVAIGGAPFGFARYARA